MKANKKNLYEILFKYNKKEKLIMAFNKQGSGKIDWTDITWNPIAGKCLHNCSYCYMHRFWRFGDNGKNQLKEKYFSDKLPDAPLKVFTGSSTDMWGDWVPHQWISKVLEFVKRHHDHIFQFLTKNPKRYSQLPVMDNAWYGTTVDGTEKTKNNLKDLVKHTNAGYNLIRFISFEPLIKLPDVTDTLELFKNIDWFIIGADSSAGAERPLNKWADYLIAIARHYNISVWVKDNYKYPEIIKEFPKL